GRARPVAGLERRELLRGSTHSLSAAVRDRGQTVAQQFSLRIGGDVHRFLAISIPPGPSGSPPWPREPDGDRIGPGAGRRVVEEAARRARPRDAPPATPPAYSPRPRFRRDE